MSEQPQEVSVETAPVGMPDSPAVEPPAAPLVEPAEKTEDEVAKAAELAEVITELNFVTVHNLPQATKALQARHDELTGSK